MWNVENCDFACLIIFISWMNHLNEDFVEMMQWNFIFHPFHSFMRKFMNTKWWRLHWKQQICRIARWEETLFFQQQQQQQKRKITLIFYSKRKEMHGKNTKFAEKWHMFYPFNCWKLDECVCFRRPLSKCWWWSSLSFCMGNSNGSHIAK